MSKLQALVEKYPEAFVQEEGSRYAFPLFGFEIEEGWADLIEPPVKFIAEYNAGKSGDDRIYINQIKQKYASLRFYTSNYTDILSNLIDEAEYRSERTCEDCGQPGEVRFKNGWRYVACHEHIVRK